MYFTHILLFLLIDFLLKVTLGLFFLFKVADLTNFFYPDHRWRPESKVEGQMLLADVLCVKRLLGQAMWSAWQPSTWYHTRGFPSAVCHILGAAPPQASDALFILPAESSWLSSGSVFSSSSYFHWLIQDMTLSLFLNPHCPADPSGDFWPLYLAVTTLPVLLFLNFSHLIVSFRYSIFTQWHLLQPLYQPLLPTISGDHFKHL